MYPMLRTTGGMRRAKYNREGVVPVAAWRDAPMAGRPHKGVLAKCGYPPCHKEKVIELVPRQAELLAGARP